MTQAAASDLIRRKIRSSATSGLGPVADQVVRAWRQVVARTLKSSVGMNASVTEVVVSGVDPDTLADSPEEGDLTALIESPSGDIGLALVDPAVLGALVEMQTIGRVTDRAPPRRKPTAVDAALAGPTIDRLLAAAGKALAEVGRPDPLTAYRFAALTDPDGPPTLALADVAHRCLCLELRIEGGAKVGKLRFLTPLASPSGGDPEQARAEWTRRMNDAVLASEVTVEARMGRIRLPAEQATALKVGGLLRFPREDLRKVRVQAPQGVVLTGARLGQSAGFRAVKLDGAADAGTKPGNWHHDIAPPEDDA